MEPKEVSRPKRKVICQGSNLRCHENNFRCVVGGDILDCLKVLDLGSILLMTQMIVPVCWDAGVGLQFLTMFSIGIIDMRGGDDSLGRHSQTKCGL